MKPPEPITVGLLTVHAEREPTRRDPSWWWRGYATIGGERHKPTFGRGARADIERAAIRWMHDRAAPVRESKVEADARADRHERIAAVWSGRVGR